MKSSSNCFTGKVRSNSCRKYENRLLKMLLAKNTLTNLDLIYSESGKEGY